MGDRINRPSAAMSLFLLAQRLVKGSGERRDWVAYVILAPVFLLFGVGVLYPLVETFRVSFLDWNGLGPQIPNGFANYFKLAKDPNFHNALRVTMTWTLATTFFSVLIGWSIALVSGLDPKRTALFRIAIFSAYGVSEVAAGVIWLGIVQPDFGMINSILRSVGLAEYAYPWLGNPATAMWVLVAAYVWTQAGLPLLTCYASVMAVPKSQIEAAYVDGATHMQVLRYILIPYSMPGLRVAIFLVLLNSLKAFDLIHVMTGGGPVRGTETIGYFMYKETVTYFKQGYGAASTFVMLLAVIIISIPLILDRSGSQK
jgi:raffinose/stachyose/melibiose transport system permease protein